MLGQAGQTAKTNWTMGHMQYLSLDQSVECEGGCQMLGLHAVLSHNGGTYLQYIIYSLNAHSDGAQNTASI